MWEFDEAVEVRSGVMNGVETPEQFLWRGRLWRVCSVHAYWTETAAWWERGTIGHHTNPADTLTPADAGDACFPVTASTGAGGDAPFPVSGGPDAASTRTSSAGGASFPVTAPTGGDAPSGHTASALTAPAYAGAVVAGPSTAYAGAGAPARDALAGPSGSTPGRGAATSPAAVGVLDAEWGPRRAVYRVEAGCGRDSRRELFDLAHDPDSGRWQLERLTNR